MSQEGRLSLENTTQPSEAPYPQPGVSPSSHTPVCGEQGLQNMQRKHSCLPGIWGGDAGCFQHSELTYWQGLVTATCQRSKSLADWPHACTLVS